jgi:hypothetical protein
MSSIEIIISKILLQILHITDNSSVHFHNIPYKLNGINCITGNYAAVSSSLTINY